MIYDMPPAILKQYFSLLLCIVAVWSMQPADTFAHQGTLPDAVVVHINEQGFDPAVIYISPGTKVTFENTGSATFWPASDNHPSHTHYAGTSLDEHCADGVATSFDACGPIAVGQSWSFVFDTVGTHRYHDHLWPHLTGEVIVEESLNQREESSLFTTFLTTYRQLMAAIYNLFAQPVAVDHGELNSVAVASKEYDLSSRTYVEIVKHQNPRLAIETLVADSDQNQHIESLCHEILHEIGYVAYEKYGSFQDAIIYQSDFCNSGYIHGIFEAYFENAAQPLDNLPAQCQAYAQDRRPFDLWQCYHGIGHGFMYFTGGALDESLQLCATRLEGDAVASCRNGAYMELFNQENLAQEKEYIEPTNPYATCAHRTVGKSDCYLYVPTYLSQTQGMDFADMFDDCRRAESGYEKSCIMGIGTEAMKRNMSNPSGVFTLCDGVQTGIDRELCVRGAVSMYLNQAGSAQAGSALCVQAPMKYQKICAEVVDNKKAFFQEL